MTSYAMNWNQKDYFQDLIKTLRQENKQKGQKDKSNYERISNKLNTFIDTLSEQIQDGETQIKQESDSISSIIKIQLYKKIGADVNQIDRQIQQSQQLLKQAKRELLLHKKIQKQNQKNENHFAQIQNLQKIKIWSQQRKILSQKRQKLYQKKKQQIQQEQNRIKQEIQQKKQRERQQRKKSVEERLKILEQNKYQREEDYKNSLEESKRIKLPKFKQIQKEYEKTVAEQNFQKEIMKKNHKQSLKLDHELIKNHQKNYMDRIYQRIKQKGYSSQRTLDSDKNELYESQFKILLKRDQEKIQKEKEKLKRRMNFQERLQSLEINVDENKKLKIQIAKDKARNPLKYNFLKQKNLNDYQIYMQFKQFGLDIDRNQLGNNYLEQVKKITQQSRLKKSNSTSGAFSANQPKTIKYKNYLQELRSNRSSYSIDKVFQKKLDILSKDENNMKIKDKLAEKLSTQTRKFDSQIKNKKIELQKLNTLTSTIKKQQQIDQIYMKSIKAKLACLQLN